MLITLLVAAALAAIAVALIIGFRGGLRPSAAKLAAMSSGTLTVTGASPRPEQGDKNDGAFVTISGTIMGADIAPTEVYGSFAWSLNSPWPQVGQELPVRYNPRDAESTWVIHPDDDPQEPRRTAQWT